MNSQEPTTQPKNQYITHPQVSIYMLPLLSSNLYSFKLRVNLNQAESFSIPFFFQILIYHSCISSLITLTLFKGSGSRVGFVSLFSRNYIQAKYFWQEHLIGDAVSSIHPIRSYMVLICPITDHIKEDAKKITGEDVHQIFLLERKLLFVINK